MMVGGGAHAWNGLLVHRHPHAAVSMGTGLAMNAIYNLSYLTLTHTLSYY